MSKRSKKNYKKKRNNILGGILIVLVTLIFISIFIFNNRQNKVKENINPLNYCLKNGNQSITTLLIDKTDKLSPIQQESLKKPE